MKLKAQVTGLPAGSVPIIEVSIIQPEILSCLFIDDAH
jgi:hypothetical protein